MKKKQIIENAKGFLQTWSYQYFEEYNRTFEIGETLDKTLHNLLDFWNSEADFMGGKLSKLKSQNKELRLQLDIKQAQLEALQREAMRLRDILSDNNKDKSNPERDKEAAFRKADKDKAFKVSRRTIVSIKIAEVESAIQAERRKAVVNVNYIDRHEEELKALREELEAIDATRAEQEKLKSPQYRKELLSKIGKLERMLEKHDYGHGYGERDNKEQELLELREELERVYQAIEDKGDTWKQQFVDAYKNQFVTDDEDKVFAEFRFPERCDRCKAKFGEVEARCHWNKHRDVTCEKCTQSRMIGYLRMAKTYEGSRLDSVGAVYDTPRISMQGLVEDDEQYRQRIIKMIAFMVLPDLHTQIDRSKGEELERIASVLGVDHRYYDVIGDHKVDETDIRKLCMDKLDFMAAIDGEAMSKRIDLASGKGLDKVAAWLGLERAYFGKEEEGDVYEADADLRRRCHDSLNPTRDKESINVKVNNEVKIESATRPFDMRDYLIASGHTLREDADKMSRAELYDILERQQAELYETDQLLEQYRKTFGVNVSGAKDVSNLVDWTTITIDGCLSLYEDNNAELDRLLDGVEGKTRADQVENLVQYNAKLTSLKLQGELLERMLRDVHRDLVTGFRRSTLGSSDDDSTDARIAKMRRDCDERLEELEELDELLTASFGSLFGGVDETMSRPDILHAIHKEAEQRAIWMNVFRMKVGEMLNTTFYCERDTNGAVDIRERVTGKPLTQVVQERWKLREGINSELSKTNVDLENKIEVLVSKHAEMERRWMSSQDNLKDALNKASQFDLLKSGQPQFIDAAPNGFELSIMSTEQRLQDVARRLYERAAVAGMAKEITPERCRVLAGQFLVMLENQKQAQLERLIARSERGDAWRRDGIAPLFGTLNKHVDLLSQFVELLGTNGVQLEQLVKKSVDVANLSAMIFDVGTR